MSDFQLDIDWPFEPLRKDSLNSAPAPIEHMPYNIKHMQYGRNLEQMIEVAAQMEESPEREALVLLLANHMKKMMLAINPDNVEDERIFKDLRALSHGAINLKTDDVMLFDYKAAPAPSKKKKKK